MHKITDKNLEARTGVCAICGPIRLTRMHRGGSCPTPKAQSAKRAETIYRYKSESGYNLIRKSQREILWSNSNHECAICQNEITLDIAKYDHCHISGEFRGWLCNSCNIALGLFRDNTDALKRAITYLGD